MKKRLLMICVVALIITGAVVLSYSFSVKTISSIQPNLKELSINEVTQIKIEKTVYDKPDGTVTNITIENKDNIEKIINVIKSAEIKKDVEDYKGGVSYSINILKQNQQEVSIKLDQGFIFDTKYSLQGNELTDLLNSILD